MPLDCVVDRVKPCHDTLTAVPGLGGMTHLTKVGSMCEVMRPHTCKEIKLTHMRWCERAYIRRHNSNIWDNNNSHTKGGKRFGLKPEPSKENCCTLSLGWRTVRVVVGIFLLYHLYNHYTFVVSPCPLFYLLPISFVNKRWYLPHFFSNKFLISHYIASMQGN